MVRRPLVLLLNGAFALALFAGPAAAVTFVSVVPNNANNGGAAYTLLPDRNYNYNSPTFSVGASVNDVFEFVYAPPPNLGANSFAAINDGAYLLPATVSWYFNTVDDFSTATLAQSIQSSGAPGQDINTALSLANGAGFYWYQFQATAGPNGGQYNLTILTAETPLPSTIVLLGSVFAGGAGFGVHRRRKAKAV
jgi:hypothetical protein